MTYVKNGNSYGNHFKYEGFENCCLSQNIIDENGYYVCSNCGMTLSRVITNNNDLLHVFYKDKNLRQNERVYSPFGPRTLINGVRDGRGNFLNPYHKALYQRLAKINRGLISGFERNLFDALPNFIQISEKLKLPIHVFQEAYKIYIIAAKKKFAQGRSIKGLIGAAVMCALRVYKIPHTYQEILDVFQIPPKTFQSCYNKIHSEILPKLNMKILPNSPELFMTKFGNKIKLSLDCQKTARNLIKFCKLNGMDTSGKDPKGYSAAALYLCAQFHKEDKTQKNICKISHISEITLRDRISDLKRYGHFSSLNFRVVNIISAVEVV